MATLGVTVMPPNIQQARLASKAASLQKLFREVPRGGPRGFSTAGFFSPRNLLLFLLLSSAAGGAIWYYKKRKASGTKK